MHTDRKIFVFIAVLLLVSFTPASNATSHTLHDAARAGRPRLAAALLERGSDVNARVEATTVEIGGKFDGDVHAESLRILGPAHATGTFRAKKLSVEEGGRLDGDFEVGDGPPERMVKNAPR